VIAVSIRHRGNDPVIAMSLGAKEHIWNPSHHFTNAELTHRVLPPSFNDFVAPLRSIAASASVVTATKRRNKGDYFKTARAKASKRRHLARPAADEVGVPLRNPADASPRLCYLLRHAARHSMAAGSPFQLMTMLPW
jgi:hypothetical protein